MALCMCCQVSYLCSCTARFDNLIHLLPLHTGDDFYVPEPHLADDLIRFSGTMEELRLPSNRLHRYEYDSPAYFVLNFPNLNGHLSPLNLPTQRKHKL